jgi:single-strand DNA-binding protein
MNRASLIGNVGKDPEVGNTTNGTRFARFPIATSERWTDKSTGEKRERTEWHNIVVWNEHLIPVIEKYVKKGTKLLVEGEIRTRKWQDDKGVDRWSTEIVLQFNGNIELLGSPPARPGDAPMNGADPYGGSRPAGANGGGAPNGANGAGNGGHPPLDDQIPF